MNPFNRPNDKPENPMDDIDVDELNPLAKLNPDKRSPATDAENPKQLATPEEIMDMSETAGPHGPVTPPGGNPMTNVGSPQGDKMQYSSEGGKTYAGSMVNSKVLKGNKSEVEND